MPRKPSAETIGRLQRLRSFIDASTAEPDEGQEGIQHAQANPPGVELWHDETTFGYTYGILVQEGGVFSKGSGDNSDLSLTLHFAPIPNSPAELEVLDGKVGPDDSVLPERLGIFADFVVSVAFQGFDEASISL
jgi:hypothetical protein